VRVIPVLDLLVGRAVRARRGLRGAYAPAPSRLVPNDAAGDPLAQARAFRDTLRCDEWYVADLDAIMGGAPQRALLRALAGLGGRLLVDGAIATADRAREVIADGGEAARAVVGLETLPSFAALADVARAVGTERVVFSLDLRDGRPVAPGDGGAPRGTPRELAAAAVAAGASGVLVLDLARVGSGRGVDLDLVAELRRTHPAVELLAGGGIASRRDLERLADAGCDGALVATAFHDGRLGEADVAALRRRIARRGKGHDATDSR
jgi:phosphoribosylformimino-5-aminoimidazole carboxamide ribotide isomerase